MKLIDSLSDYARNDSMTHEEQKDVDNIKDRMLDKLTNMRLTIDRLLEERGES